MTGRMGLEPILPVRQPVTISTMLNFDSDGDGIGDGVGMCKQALICRHLVTYSNSVQILSDGYK